MWRRDSGPQLIELAGIAAPLGVRIIGGFLGAWRAICATAGYRSARFERWWSGSSTFSAPRSGRVWPASLQIGAAGFAAWAVFQARRMIKLAEDQRQESVKPAWEVDSIGKLAPHYGLEITFRNLGPGAAIRPQVSFSADSGKKASGGSRGWS
jgi:hypothetical protein